MTLLRLTLLAVVGLVGLGVCAPVHAFQNPTRFLEDPVESGGGGKRFFTGSPADGYTCKACHAPGHPAHVGIAGIPVDGYVPGQTYPFVIDWADDLMAVGLNAEITDQTGVAVGQLVAPPVNQLTPADLCNRGRLSGAVIAPLGTRSVALVGECGQHQTTLLWTAPAVASTGPVWFSGSLVVSDSKGDVKGDSVTDFRRALTVQGSVAPPTTSISEHSSCAVSSIGTRTSTSTHAPTEVACLLLGVAGWLVRLRTRRRR